ncbi:IS3 family transposase [Clostridium beijerinckii]
MYYNNYRYKWDLKKMTPVQLQKPSFMCLNTLFYIVLTIGIRLN